MGNSKALQGIRIADFTGQLGGRRGDAVPRGFRGAGDPRRGPGEQGGGTPSAGHRGPYVDDRRGIEFGTILNNHNVEKLGITLNLRSERGKELLRRADRDSDVVTENFAAGVLERMGFGYDALQRDQARHHLRVELRVRPASGRTRRFKTWGPIVQAVSGLTFTSGLPDQPPAGWGYTYMDHIGGDIMAVAMLAALLPPHRTGEGQWVDMSCTEAGDHAGRSRPARLHGQRPPDCGAHGSPNSNRSQLPLDGAARHLPRPGRRQLGGHRLP